MTRFVLSLAFLFAIMLPCRAQLTQDPTTWTYEVKKVGEGTYNLFFKLSLKESWHIWAMQPGGDGFQIAPTFTFEKGGYRKAGEIKESGAHKHTGPMDGVDGDVSYFDGQVVYTQTVHAKKGAVIKGKHEYQVCNDRMCLPPRTKLFVFKIES